jgi:hypothetical protein
MGKILIGLLVVFAVSEDCSRFLCKLDSQFFDTNTCVGYIGNVYYVSPCKSGTCIANLGTQNSTCVFSYNLKKNLHPGSRCTTGEDCSFKVCINNVCAGATLNDKCVINTDCNPGFYCSYQGFCQTLIPVGSTGCINDYQCSNNAGCNITDSIGTCIKSFSINAGEYVSSCLSQNYNFLCNSGTCVSKNGFYVCIDAIENVAEDPYLCKGDRCQSKPDPVTGTTFFSDCTCGLGDGAAYCNLYFGDSYGKVFLSYFRQWSLSAEIFKCNTDLRYDMDCVNTWWDTKKATGFSYYYYYYNYYPYVAQAQDCVTQVYLPLFYEAKLLYEQSYSCINSFTGFAIVYIMF